MERCASPSTRRAWIEIGTVTNEGGLGEESPSTRRAWIEIVRVTPIGACADHVALHPEGVDRNYTAGVYGWNADVALHPEGVDRNAVTLPV